ncbi:phage baseplate protein [Erwinia pyrifoliae]|uniref:Phage tail protein n=1 Tax=Erwinia pyrifoliae TaxID=79967 RepID=A0ABY5XCN2_ERWPY|nr:phage tail protein [Erwinia pyrifoliae]UWS35094.1 phage tail protein [Erwinia pyrifoliae]
MTKVFKTPFAAQGDRTAVPVETQDDGSVSYTQGYGYDYERDQTTDPAAKDIEREKMNALFHDVTEAVGEVQAFGAAVWSEDGKPYAIRSQAYYGKKLWQSKIGNNNEEPGKGSGWVEFKADVNPVDMLYPIGIVTWFAQKKDPNKLFPGTTWKYIGENRTIRLASANGSDVMTTGGSDSVTLAVGNIPAHGHTFSANTGSFDYGSKKTSDFDYGNKQTDWQGNHNHGVNHRVSNVASETNSYSDVLKTGGGVNFQTNDAGNHQHNLWIGSHNHDVWLGAHSHSVSGTTANTGAGTAINVTNAFIKLMGWYRSA